MNDEFPSIPNLDLQSWGLAGVAVFVLMRFIWPWLRSMTDNQLANARTENALLAQALDERDKALARADAADTRADALFVELAAIRSDLKIMTFKLEISDRKLTELRNQLDGIRGTAEKAVETTEDVIRQIEG